MKVIAAYLLAVLGGNVSPCADDLKSILGSGMRGNSRPVDKRRTKEIVGSNPIIFLFPGFLYTFF